MIVVDIEMPAEGAPLIAYPRGVLAHPPILGLPQGTPIFRPGVNAEVP